MFQLLRRSASSERIDQMVESLTLLLSVLLSLWPWGSHFIFTSNFSFEQITFSHFVKLLTLQCLSCQGKRKCNLPTKYSSWPAQLKHNVSCSLIIYLLYALKKKKAVQVFCISSYTVSGTQSSKKKVGQPEKSYTNTRVTMKAIVWSIKEIIVIPFMCICVLNWKHVAVYNVIIM